MTLNKRKTWKRFLKRDCSVTFTLFYTEYVWSLHNVKKMTTCKTQQEIWELQKQIGRQDAPLASRRRGGWARACWCGGFLRASITASTRANNAVNAITCEDIDILLVVFPKWVYVTYRRLGLGASRHWVTFDRRITCTIERDLVGSEVSTIFWILNDCPHASCIQISIQIPDTTQWSMSKSW